MGLLANLSDDEDTDKHIINDFEEFITELDFQAELPKKPDPLCSVRQYNRRTLENQYVNELKRKNMNEGKIVELLTALKFKMHVPLYCQL